MTELIVYCLAVYGLSWSLVEADGPWDMLNRFRYWAGVRYADNGERYGVTMVGKALNCPICTSYWVSIPLLVVLMLNVVLLYPISAVGVVTFITEMVHGNHG